MGISIKNDQVEAMIRALAERTGETVTEAVGAAVRDKLDLLDRLPEELEALRRAKLEGLLAKIRSLPVLDDRDHGDMLYDDGGLPK